VTTAAKGSGKKKAGATKGRRQRGALKSGLVAAKNLVAGVIGIGLGLAPAKKASQEPATKKKTPRKKKAAASKATKKATTKKATTKKAAARKRGAKKSA
jgi:hypothetical protein